eukprot:989003-Prymnesium_polylepis.2
MENLLSTEGCTKFGYLHAQIVKARAQGVEQALLERFSQKLKTLKVGAPDPLRVKRSLRWERVTTGADDEPIEACCALDGCSVADPIDDEVLELEGGTVEAALSLMPKDVAPCAAAPAPPPPPPPPLVPRASDGGMIGVSSGGGGLAGPVGRVGSSEARAEESCRGSVNVPARPTPSRRVRALRPSRAAGLRARRGTSGCLSRSRRRCTLRCTTVVSGARASMSSSPTLRATRAPTRCATT